MTTPVKPICRGEQPCEAGDGLAPAPESEACKTNPIGRRAEIPQHSTILSFHHSSPMPIVQTRRPRQKSPRRGSTCVSGRISRIGAVDPDFCRARQTKPNLGTLGYLGNDPRDAEQMRQTNPISGRAK